METTAKKNSKPRGPRRNFERELVDIKRYCEVNIEVLEGLANGAVDPMLEGKIASFKSILGRLNGFAAKKGE